MQVLNVGGGASRHLPPHYDGWQQVLMDIDPAVNPDLVCDARELCGTTPAAYDAVYCSHNLEHVYRHEVPTVLAGFKHVLKPGGRVEIYVPNLINLMQSLLSAGRDLDDVWYMAGANPIRFHDVLYGWGQAMEKGNLFYAHKCGFSQVSLCNALLRAGFDEVQVHDQGANLMGVATCR